MSQSRKSFRDHVVVTPIKDMPRQKLFSVRRLLTYNTEKYFSRGMLVPDPEDHLSEALELAKRLFEHNGVQSILVSQYDIYVTIGRAFDWKLDHLESAVLSTIKKYFEDFYDALEDASDLLEKRSKKKKGKSP
ncbi:NifU N-terminal domain-containing protein [Patescibacteria group bacterium]|nr:NifU N-terminal domain-containing protein [Patescibacteria group bacterium]